MGSFFQLDKHNTTWAKEFFAGCTSFLSMSYILFVNPAILSGMGMPYGGVFAATAITAAICTLIMALYSNTPFAMAPGMGINTFIAYTVSLEFNFHWKEALAMVFLVGVVHFLLMITDTRKLLVQAVPKSLRYASGVAIGLFIAYVGIKNAGLLTFIVTDGHYIMTESKTVLADSTTVPGIVTLFGFQQIIALIGLFIILFLLALEKKTGDSYAALLIGIITATFIGIPLQVTHPEQMILFDFSLLQEFCEICTSFFSDPGLLSLIQSPEKILVSVLMILFLLLTNVVDSISTIVGIGQLQESTVFDTKDIYLFDNVKGPSSKLDKVLIANSTGGIVGSLLGVTTGTTFVESITGIVAKGKTGLTGVVIAILFLISLVFSSFLKIIPLAAIAPALIVVGVFLITLVKQIDWDNVEDAIPAAVLIISMPLTYSVIDGVILGFLAHLVVKAAMGKWREVHPVLYLIIAIFIVLLAVRSLAATQ